MPRRQHDAMRRIACLIGFAIPFGASLPASGSGDGLPVVHLAFREHIVTLIRGEEGPRYTVRDVDGTLRHERLTERELISSYPELHRKLRSAVADGARSGTLLWAGHGPPAW